MSSDKALSVPGVGDREALFAREYLVDFNGTRAAKRAGYKGGDIGAGVYAAKALRKASVVAYLQQLAEKRIKKADITAERVLEEYAQVAFADVGDFITISDNNVTVDFSRITPGQTRAISEISTTTRSGGRNGRGWEETTTKIKLHAKLAALDALARHLNMAMAVRRLAVDTTDRHVVSLSLADLSAEEREVLRKVAARAQEKRAEPVDVTPEPEGKA